MATDAYDSIVFFSYVLQVSASCVLIALSVLILHVRYATMSVSVCVVSAAAGWMLLRNTYVGMRYLCDDKFFRLVTVRVCLVTSFVLVWTFIILQVVLVAAQWMMTMR